MTDDTIGTVTLNPGIVGRAHRYKDEWVIFFSIEYPNSISISVSDENFRRMFDFTPRGTQDENDA